MTTPKNSLQVVITLDEPDSNEDVIFYKDENGNYVFECDGKIKHFHFHFGPGPDQL